MRHLYRVHLCRVATNATWGLRVCSAHILCAVTKLATLLCCHDLLSDVLSCRLATQINRVVSLLACSGVLLVCCCNHLIVVCSNHLPHLLSPIILVEI